MYYLHAKPSPGPEISAASQPAGQVRPPLHRADSRPTFPPQQFGLRPGVPLNAANPNQAQNIPQFQPGAPVNPGQFPLRPNQSARPPYQQASLPPQQFNPQRVPGPPSRHPGTQSFVPQQAPRPQGPTPQGPFPPRGPPLHNLQFGPRQPSPPGAPPTPTHSSVPPTLPTLPLNSVPRQPIPGKQPSLENHRSGAPPHQLSPQSSQASLKGVGHTPALSNKQGTLENPGPNVDKNILPFSENGFDGSMGAPKNRSFSIAAAPGSVAPFKTEDDRRKSMTVLTGRTDESISSKPNLGFIQESIPDQAKLLKENIMRGSRESVKSDASNESNRDSGERPDSRLSGSKMSESFIGSFTNDPAKKFDNPQAASPPMKKRVDDDQDVVTLSKSNIPTNIKNTGTPDRSPSLSDSSSDKGELKKPEVDIHRQVGQITPTPSFRPASGSLAGIKTPEPLYKTQTKPGNERTESMIENPQSVKREHFIANVDSVPPSDGRSSTPSQNEPTDLNSPARKATEVDSAMNRTPRKSMSATARMKQRDGDNDSGVDESTQGHDGSPGSPKKSPSKIPSAKQSNGIPKQSNGIPKPTLSRSSSKSANAKTPESATNQPITEKKKVPMNKVQVGNAPSPNISSVKSKIGSLQNASHKPGGGGARVKIESRKLDFHNVTPRIAAKNETYVPGGGAKKITQNKLHWNAKSKIGSLDNTAYKPGGGDKKIETVKLDFKDKAKPKVASTVNITHKPGGGTVKIESQKLEIKAQSKVGSLDNVKHKPGGGDIKIFDDKDYIKQIASPALSVSGQEAYEDMSVQDYSEIDNTRPMSRCKSARYQPTRSPSPGRRQSIFSQDMVLRNNEKNLKQVSERPRPRSAREPLRARSGANKIGADGKRPPFVIF